MKGDILVLSEHKGTVLDNITWELLNKGRALADTWQTKLAVLVIGHQMESLVDELIRSGANEIWVAEDAVLEQYQPEIYTSVITKIIKKHHPSLVLMGYTYLGMEIGPAVAVRLNGTVATNCTGLEVEGDRILVVRPMFSGTFQAKFQLNGPAPYVISVEKGILPKDVRSVEESVVKTIPVECSGRRLRRKILDQLIPVPGTVDITKAHILVSVGRGIGSPDKIQIIKDLASALGGAVACSRPVVDMGWLPEEHQVGISANAVAPDVYIACGISGASQHVTAMRDSGTIIVINKDPNAPIFHLADYGYVGDMFDIIPELIQEAHRLK